MTQTMATTAALAAASLPFRETVVSVSRKQSHCVANSSLNSSPLLKKVEQGKSGD